MLSYLRRNAHLVHDRLRLLELVTELLVALRVLLQQELIALVLYLVAIPTTVVHYEIEQVLNAGRQVLTPYLQANVLSLFIFAVFILFALFS